MPHAFIAADVIAGFPHETAEDFAEAKAFIASLPLAALHVFTYSERPGTPAANMPESVPMCERHRRSMELQELSDQKKEAFYRANKGRKANVLWEADNEDGMMYGFTENYIRVGRKFDEQYINEITEETIEIIDHEHKSYIV